jgi:hypothetical protein
VPLICSFQVGSFPPELIQQALPHVLPILCALLAEAGTAQTVIPIWLIVPQFGIDDSRIVFLHLPLRHSTRFSISEDDTLHLVLETLEVSLARLDVSNGQLAAMSEAAMTPLLLTAWHKNAEDPLVCECVVRPNHLRVMDWLMLFILIQFLAHVAHDCVCTMSARAFVAIDRRACSKLCVI